MRQLCPRCNVGFLPEPSEPHQVCHDCGGTLCEMCCNVNYIPESEGGLSVREHIDKIEKSWPKTKKDFDALVNDATESSPGASGGAGERGDGT